MASTSNDRDTIDSEQAARAEPSARTPRNAALRAERSGRVFTWLAGGALAFNVLMIVGLLALLAWMGMGYFWPKSIHELVLDDGSKTWGEVLDRREKNLLAARTAADSEAGSDTVRYELNVKRGNREIYGQSNDFRWIDENRIHARSTPADIVHLERLENGNFHGRLVELRVGAQKLDVAGEQLFAELQRLIAKKAELRDEIHAIEYGPIDDLNHELEKLRLAKRGVELKGLAKSEEERRLADLESQRTRLIAESERYTTDMIAMRERLADSVAVLEDRRRHTARDRDRRDRACDPAERDERWRKSRPLPRTRLGVRVGQPTRVEHPKAASFRRSSALCSWCS